MSLTEIENSNRKASREQVQKISKYYNVPVKELMVDWLSDKIIYEIGDEEFGQEALKVAERKIKYNKNGNNQ